MVQRIEGIKESELRRLYHEEKWDKKKIAVHYGCSPGVITRRMEDWGIKKMKRTERSYFPRITGQHESLLIGSMLGDARISRSQYSEVCSFREGHASDQLEYLRWKYESWWKPYVNNGIRSSAGNYVYKLEKNKDKDNTTWWFETRGHPSLLKWRDMFYEKGSVQAKKQIQDPLVSDLVDEFALTIWYLDDGNAGHFPSISFGMNPESRRIAEMILQKYGLKYKWKFSSYNEVSGPDTGFFQIGYDGESESAERFHKIISPHVPNIEVMQKKLEWGNHSGSHNKIWRDLEDKHQFIVENVNVLSIRSLAKEVGHSCNALERHMKKHKISHPREKGRRAHNGYELYNYPSKEWKLFPKEKKEEEVDRIYILLRGFGFPKDQKNENLKTQFTKLQQRDFTLKEGIIQKAAKIGIKIIKYYFPLRYEARNGGGSSAKEIWFTKKGLKGAIRHRLSEGKSVSPISIRNSITSLKHTPSLFRPCFMKYMAETYSEPEDWIWDPCMGYGGRLFGTLAAGRRYVGTEILKETFEGNVKLYEDMKGNIEGLEEKAILLHRKAQDFEFGEKVGLVFTSPPYYDTEQYGSKKMLHTYDQWVESFLRPVVKKAFEALRDNGFFAMNIAKIKKGRKTYDIPSSLLEVSEEEGFEFRDEIKMPLSGAKKSEPILVFKKVKK